MSGPPRQGGTRRGGTGHRALPHTADLTVEAWAPTREECLAEAVRAVVAGFAEIPPDAPRTRSSRLVAAETDDRLPAAVLDEVIYLLDVRGEVVAEVDVAPREHGVEMRFAAVGQTRVRQVGAVPKAVSLHGIRLGRDGAGWSCRVTLDV